MVAIIKAANISDSPEINLGKCSFSLRQNNTDFAKLFCVPYVGSFEVLTIGSRQALSVSSCAKTGDWLFLHGIRGKCRLKGTKIAIGWGDYLLLQLSPAMMPLSLQYCSREDARLAVVRLHDIINKDRVVRLPIPQNISDRTFDPRPQGICLKSLLSDSPLADYIGYEFVEMLPHSKVPCHLHPKSDAIVYVVKGEGAFIVENTRVFVTEGDRGCIPRGEWHAVEAGAEGMNFISLQTPPSGAEEGKGYVFKHDYPVDREIHLS
jgi:quercetin dioxygenase-like cupin family protein